MIAGGGAWHFERVDHRAGSGVQFIEKDLGRDSEAAIENIVVEYGWVGRIGREAGPCGASARGARAVRRQDSVFVVTGLALVSYTLRLTNRLFGWKALLPWASAERQATKAMKETAAILGLRPRGRILRVVTVIQKVSLVI